MVGKSVPIFIHNDQFHFTNLEVYEDGAIECWGVVDLNGFVERLKSGWVTPSIPSGGNISIHGLGNWTVGNCKWNYGVDDFNQYILSVVRELNPEMINLYQHREKIINGVRYGEDIRGNIFKKKNVADINPFSENIYGEMISIFYYRDNQYHLVRLLGYADGKIEILDLDAPIQTDMAGLKELIDQKTLLSEIPPSSQVNIFGLGSFSIQKTNYVIEVNEKYLEMLDIVEKLNKRPNSISKCLTIFNSYKATPTNELRTQLKSAYEKVPKQSRRYLGDMDVKDIPIRMIIYGEQEIEKWSHYVAAKNNNLQLPTITIPRPTD